MKKLRHKDVSEDQAIDDAEEAKTRIQGLSEDYSPPNKRKPFSLIDQMASHTNIRKVYKFGKNIGGGYFGMVRLGELISDPQHKYAVKSISKESIAKEVKLLEAEILNLKAADHPNILTFLEIYSDVNYVHIVTELCTGGELLVKLAAEKCFTEKVASHYMSQILSAVRFLHGLGICHRDLKLENFLFQTSDINS